MLPLEHRLKGAGFSPNDRGRRGAGSQDFNASPFNA
jgi:hypothetical protein